MVPNPAIRNLIREDKVHQIYSQMQVGQAKFGMQTLNQALCDLFVKQIITLEDAMACSSDIDELKTMIGAAQGAAAGRESGPPAINRGRPGERRLLAAPSGSARSVRGLRRLPQQIKVEESMAKFRWEGDDALRRGPRGAFEAARPKRR